MPARVSLPINFLGREFAEARLDIVEPKQTGKKEIPTMMMSRSRAMLAQADLTDGSG